MIFTTISLNFKQVAKTKNDAISKTLEATLAIKNFENSFNIFFSLLSKTYCLFNTYADNIPTTIDIKLNIYLDRSQNVLYASY